jgi:hypothetical protein
MVRIEMPSETGEDAWAEVDGGEWTFSDAFAGLAVLAALEAGEAVEWASKPDPDLERARLVISFPPLKSAGARIVEHDPTHPGPSGSVF